MDIFTYVYILSSSQVNVFQRTQAYSPMFSTNKHLNKILTDND